MFKTSWFVGVEESPSLPLAPAPVLTVNAFSSYETYRAYWNNIMRERDLRNPFEIASTKERAYVPLVSRIRRSFDKRTHRPIMQKSVRKTSRRGNDTFFDRIDVASDIETGHGAPILKNARPVYRDERGEIAKTTWANIDLYYASLETK